MDMAKLLQMMMAGGMGGNAGDNSENSDSSARSDNPDSSDKQGYSENNDNNDDFAGSDFADFFENIDFDMISKMGELFSHMNKPDKNSELLSALRSHLRDENQHKIDTAMKLSRMVTLLPLLKDSGILNNLF
ncbi:MAG: hypothetical protein FWF76_06715 [Oscillospiraceae bacterium]|nr:hypothetical protein [Oscillospiraceae bacterium]